MSLRDKITTLIEHLAAYEKIKRFRIVNAGMFGEDSEKEKKEKKDKGEPVLEGISFRFKTVQYHLVDDTFEEIKKNPEVFGDLKIFAESFSLPGWGEENEDLDRDEYQFKITALIESKADRDKYYQELQKVMDTIEEKHNLSINVEPTEKFYNVNYIIFHTKREGVFSKE